MVIAAPSSTRNENLADTYEKLRRAPHEFKLLHFPERTPVGAHTAEPNRVYLATAQPFNEHDEAATIVRKLVAGIRAGEIAKDDETKRILDMAREIGVALAVAIRTAVEAAVAHGGLPLSADGVTILRPPAANDDAPVIEPEAPKALATRRSSPSKTRQATRSDDFDAERLKREIDIVALIGKDTRLLKNGSEFLGLCPLPGHKEKTPSLNVNPSKRAFHCFGCGRGGSVIDYVMEMQSLSSVNEACRWLGGSNIVPLHRHEPTVAPEPVDPYAGYLPADPPADAAELFQVGVETPRILNIKRSHEQGRQVWGSFTPSHVAAYRDATGKLIGFVLRHDFVADGKRKKETPAIQYVQTPDGELLWARMHFSEPRPLYGLDRLAKTPECRVLAHEGEKKTDAAEGAFASAGQVNITWPGGAGAVDKADWSPVRGHNVMFWPDCDLAGYQAVLGSQGKNGKWNKGGAELALDAGAPTVAMINVIDPGQDGFVPTKEGWDAADAVETGWDFDRTKAWIAQRKIVFTTGEEVRQAAQRLLPKITALFAKPEPAPTIAPQPAQPQPEEAKAEPGAEAKAEQPKAAVGAAAESTTAAHTGVNPSNHFVPLGHDHGKHFFFQREAQQVLSYSGGELMTEGAMTDLAPINWWEISFPGDKGMNKKSAIDWLKRTSYKHGIFKVRAKIRGRGAWMDDGRVVYHLGDRLFVDGKEMGVDQIKSRYIYEQREELPMPAQTALTDAEGAHLIEIASMFRWEKKVSGVLAAGWIALAPVCGALGWRPHVWITGEAHCGKSTFVERFAFPLTNEACVYAQGNSTEAGIRQDLDGAALPVIFDESEANNERESMRVDNVLSLIRQSSSASKARTLKGTPVGKGMEFHIQSMFMLSSIGVSMKLQPDLERIAKLSLMKPEKGDEAARNKWRKQLAPKLAEIKRDNTIGARLLRRSLDLLPITLESIKVFIEVYSARFGSERDGDQYGTLLAGAWSLAHSKPVTRGAAEAFIDQFEWTDHLEETESDEPSRARAALLSAKVRFDGGRELSVHELVCIAAGKKLGYANVGTDQAAATLKRNGLLVKLDAKAEDGVGILLFQNNSQEIPRLLVGTAYQASWRDQLLRAGAKKHLDAAGRQKSEWFIGGAAKCIELPLKSIIDAGGEEGRFFADDDEGPV
jgi:putative DNA primase/helicase